MTYERFITSETFEIDQLEHVLSELAPIAKEHEELYNDIEFNDVPEEDPRHERLAALATHAKEHKKLALLWEQAQYMQGTAYNASIFSGAPKEWDTIEIDRATFYAKPKGDSA